MASAAQILANKANAQHSTGPKTDAGKTTSSQNATKHGFTSKTFVILPGQEEAFETLESTLRQQFAPDAGYQEFVFNRILHAAWTQHRCECAEVELHSESATPTRDPFITESLERKVRTLATYATRAERSFHKYVKELRELKNEARYRRGTEAKAEPSVLTEVQKVDAAVDRTDTGRYRRDIHLAATAEQTIKAHFAKQEQAKPIGTDRGDDREEEGFSFGRLFRR